MPPLGQYGSAGSYSGKMPMKATRRASSSLNGHNPLPQDPKLEAEIEDFGPPEWRTVLNSRADLGYPDFYPSRPGFNQTEDVLTDEFVKNGFSAKTFVAVGAESFSMHGPIYGHLMNGCLGMLNRLGQEIAQKRTESIPQFGERAFKIPVRVTYNDVRRHQFLADLANPNIPLSRLMLTSVPHGFKGVELFETMFSPPQPPSRVASGSSSLNGSSGPPTPPAPIPIDRALWFIRVLGANEISMHRGRAQTTAVSAPVVASPMPATPSSTATAPAAQVQLVSSSDWYTGEFTSGFCGWLRNQLAQLNLPVAKGKAVAATTGPPAKAPAGVLGDEKARTRWIAKWDYSTKLLREMEERQLISKRMLIGWLVDTLAAANLAQIGFVLQLLGDRLPELGRHASIARWCVRVACAKLVEIRASPTASAMAKVEGMLQQVVVTLFDHDYTILMSRATWRQHEAVIESVLVPPRDNASETMTLPNGTLRPPQPRRPRIAEVKMRSERLDFTPVAADDSTSPRRQQMQDLRKLDGMDADTDMTELCKAFFDGSASPTSPNIDISRLEDKTFVLLNWAMGLFQLGVHRAYAVHTLLTIWSELHAKTVKAAKSANTPATPVEFFDILYKWLDTCEAPRKDENAFAIGITFGDLTRQGLFSYRRYLEMLIACGHTARAMRPGQPRSHHLPLLAAMPIFTEAKDFLYQRRLALCGDDEEAGKEWEDDERRLMEEFREEVKEYVPEIFGMDRYGRSESLREVVYHPMPSAPALNRFLFLQVRFWLAPAAAERLKPQPGRAPMDASTFVRVVHVFHLCNGYSTIADFLIKALVWSTDEEILDVVIDTIRRAADVWTANDKWQLLTNALMDRNQAQDRRGRHHSGLANLLLELAKRGRLSEDDEEEVRASIEQHPKDLPTTTVGWVDAKESMGQLQQVISAGNVGMAKTLAGKLFTRHGPFASWSSVWWSTLAGGVLAPEGARTSLIVEASMAHITEVDDHTDSTLDSVVAAWLDDLTIPSIIDKLALKSASGLIEILLNLVAKRRLRIVPQLLSRLAYSTWKYAATGVLATKGRLSTKSLRAVESSMILTQHLLLTTPPNSALPPVNLRQSLVMQTERREAFNATNVPDLIRHLPFLVILDTARTAPERLKQQTTDLLQGLARTPQFKAAAFRNLHILKDAFLSNEWSKPGIESGVEARMVDGLKLIMSQGTSYSNENLHAIATLESSTRFSAWRWTSIVLGMRVEFKRLALRIENGDEAAEARITLNQLVHATLDRDASADDTDLLCEAFRGMETVAAQEIVAVGLERLTALLGGMIGAESQDGLEAASRSVDLLLRVLDSAAMSTTGLGEHGFLAARHGLIDIISLGLQAVERYLSTEEDSPLPDGVVPPRPMDLFKVLLHLIKFVLGLQVIEAPSLLTPRPDFGRLAGAFLRILAVISKTASADLIGRLTDVLIHIVDSAPAVSRGPVHAALLAEMAQPSITPALERHPLIATALPYVPAPRRPVALVNANLGAEGEEGSVQLDDRPWEMLEVLDGPRGSGRRKTPHGELFLGHRAIKDTASVPIALFGAVMKRDEVPGEAVSGRRGVVNGKTRTNGEEGEADDGKEVEHVGRDEDEGPTWTDYASERNLGDGLAGEPGAVRQLVTGLYACAQGQESVEDDSPKKETLIAPTGTPTKLVSASSPAMSTASGTTTARPRRASVRSTTSTQTVQSTLAQHAASAAAAAQKGTSKDPFELDESSDSDSSDSDDLEVLDWPPGKRPRVSGKGVPGKTNATAATGGGAAAGQQPRRTTGGKTVGKTVGVRRATGGKSVGRTGGKMPGKKR